MSEVLQHRATNWLKTLYINGEAILGKGASLSVEDPASEEQLATLSAASVEQSHEAVAAARRAFDSGVWNEPSKRRAALAKLADLLEERKDDFAGALVQEVGTPIGLAKPLQVGAPIQLLRFFAEAACKDRTEFLGRHPGPPSSESVVFHRPVGVVAAITAFNYPILLAAAKVGAALAAGCTVVLLPSPLAPLATLMLAGLVSKAGFPPGVFNIIVGGADIGRVLTEHPDIDKVSFTGSVAVGRMIMQQAAMSGPRDVLLELGGKSAAIIFPAEDFTKIAPGLHGRYSRNAGQGCGSPTRILVPAARLQEFIDVSKAVYATIRVGDPWDPATAVGPLITRARRDEVEEKITEAIRRGATIVAGGGRPPMRRGWFMNPTLLANVTNADVIARNELFAPIAVVLPYRDLDDAVHMANDSEYGLVSYLYGPTAECKAIVQRLRVGTVAINGGGGMRVDAPLGGFKHSGIGREWGDAGVREFLTTQHVQACD
jgi:aldehyde dehydrogenase (NAD+)/betaine-aldehyde dehydrogenase